MPASRQLNAIMFADIAGYTAMMQRDEALALQLRNKFQETLEEEVRIHYGRILEMKGDGGMCIFASNIEAVRAAVSRQRPLCLCVSVFTQVILCCRKIIFMVTA